MKKGKFKLFQSLYIKFMFSFLLVGVFPLLIVGLINFNMFSSTTQERALDTLKNYQTNLYSSINEDLNDLSNLINQFKYYLPNEIPDDKNVAQLLQSMEQFDVNPKISVILNSLLQSKDIIENIILINNRGIWTFTSRYKKYANSQYDFSGGTLITQIKSCGDEISVIPSHSQEYFYNMNDYVFSVAKNFIYDGEWKGTILIDVNVSYFGRLFDQTSIPESTEAVYLTDANNYCIFSNRAWDIDTTLNLSDYPNYSIDETIPTRFNRNDYIYLNAPLLSYGWKLISKVDVPSLSSYVNPVRNLYFLSILLTCLLLIALSILFSKKLSSPVRDMRQTMKLVQSGRLDIRLKNRGNDEFGQITTSINEMIANLDLYIKRSYDAQLKQKEAELNAIKMQINPHFLYNMLEIMHMTAIEEDAPQVSGMIVSLSKQLRYLLSVNGDFVRVSDELEVIRQYFSFVQMRYDNAIKLTINVQKSLYDFMILKFMLQPIIENSIKHGYVEGQDMKIIVNGFIVDQTIRIDIFDNGRGMSVSELEAVKNNSLTNSGTIPSKNIGLKNVYERIKFFYGQQYSLEIESSQDVGTMIKLTLPIMKAGEEIGIESNKDRYRG